MCFNLINNFNRPYFSVSITDFWRRWHISLSTWLKDYIFIPLGGSRCGKARNYTNILITFLVSGIWHGANWTYIVWGVLHGAVQIVEKFFGWNKAKSEGIVRLLRIVVTFIIANILWVFFRMPTLSDAWQYLMRMFTTQSPDMSIILGNKTLLIPLYILIIKDTIDEFFPKLSFINSRYIVVRWLTYILLTSMILLFGVFDASQFIYISF